MTFVSLDRTRRKKGQAILEFSLVCPALFIVMLVILDFGIWIYAFISVENAARAAAMRNSLGQESASDQSAACNMVREELRGLPNIGYSYQGNCTSAPLVVASVYCSGNGACAGAASTADGGPASAITVTYTIPGAFALPFAKFSTVTRTARMRIVNPQ